MTHSVWSLEALQGDLKGDLAIACSDKMIWIFTRDPARFADATTQKVSLSPATFTRPSLADKSMAGI